MDLDTLFTNTDYKIISVNIPCHTNATKEDDDRTKEITIHLECSQSSSTDFDLTGQILWPVSVYLSHYLASPHGRDLLRSKHVVELGAGCGLPGLVAAHFSSSSVLTDGNEIVMDLLQRNVARQNNDGIEMVDATQFVWGNVQQLKSVMDKMEGHVDVIVAADVVQWPAVVEPLLLSVKTLLSTSTCNSPTFVVGIVNRANTTFSLFFDLAQSMGFAIQEISEKLIFPPDGIIPKSCQEFGGLKTQVFELVLKKTNDEHTDLLTQQGSTDRILGKGFEMTSFLPC